MDSSWSFHSKMRKCFFFASVFESRLDFSICAHQRFEKVNIGHMMQCMRLAALEAATAIVNPKGNETVDH